MSEQRESLLRKWAELAPGELQIDGGFFRYLPQAQGRFIENVWSFSSFLLSALIEASRARGWHYFLASDETVEASPPQSWVQASVVVDARSYDADIEKEPCDALLSAYVQALEAVTAKESSYA